MTKEKPPSGEFDEAAFIAEAEAVFKEQARLRQALVLSVIEKPIDVRAYEDYLHIEDEFLLKLDAYGKSGFVDNVVQGIKDEFLSVPLEEGDEQFLEEFSSIGREGETEMLDTLKEQYGPITGPLTPLFEKEDLFNVRALAVWAKYVKNVDAVGTAKKGLVRVLAEGFIREGRDMPPALLILIPQPELLAMEKHVGEMEQEGVKLHREIIRGAQKERDHEKAELRETGVHPKFAKKIAEEKTTKLMDNLMTSLKELVPEKAKERDSYLKTCKDPRELVDVILDVKDGKLGGKL